MTTSSIASKAKVSTRTIQRRIEKFNTSNHSHEKHQIGKDIPASSTALIQYLESEFHISLSENQEYKTPEGAVRIAKHIAKPKKQKATTPTALQVRLSADWIVIVVLIIVLGADMIAFALIGNHEFSENIPFAWAFFALLGFATGTGSVITYNRIKDETISFRWKIFFSILQYSVFSFSINERWFLAELVMTLMFVTVFVGVQRSIKT
jgi:hypothetical protein